LFHNPIFERDHSGILILFSLLFHNLLEALLLSVKFFSCLIFPKEFFFFESNKTGCIVFGLLIDGSTLFLELGLEILYSQKKLVFLSFVE
jgi:hypothetical protein